jgi:DNA-directed RNA polymerase specialized sigma24 family protein
MADTSSLRRIIQTIRTGTSDEQKHACTDLFARLHERLLGLADANLRETTKTVTSASDVVQTALASLYRAIKESHFAPGGMPVQSWEAMAITFVDRKVRDANKKAIRQKRGGGRVKNDPKAVAESTSMPGRDSSLGDEFNIALDQIAAWFPEADGTAEVFRRLVIEGNTHDQVAAAIGRSARTVHNKKNVIICHIMDRFLGTIGIPRDQEQALRLVLDPRKRVDAEAQQPGPRISEFDRRIIAAARLTEIGPDEMRSRLHKGLARLLQELEDATS